MRKAIVMFLFFFITVPVHAEELSKTLSGKILLQVESYGRAWYVYPEDHARYYLKDGETAYELMSSLGLGISNSDLKSIPVKEGEYADNRLVERLKGRILLQVESRGEAWYVNPSDGLRYYMADGKAAYEIMRTFSLGIADEDLSSIPINSKQIVPDTAYNQVAYVNYENSSFGESYFGDTILPLASMTKLMTALVLLDEKPNFDDKIIITQDILDYPIAYVGNDATSEIALSLGDTIAFYDLWVAMLLSSSNQAAFALVDSRGYSVDEFVAKMNAKAESLNLRKTKFFDVAGLDAHNVTTPKEMTLIAERAFDQPIISEITILEQYSFTAHDALKNQKTIIAVNRNYSLMQFKPEGVKTGYLVEAQRNVVLKKNGKIVVIMHALSMSERNEIISKLLK